MDITKYNMGLIDYLNPANNAKTGFSGAAQSLFDNVASRYGTQAQQAGNAATGDTVTLSEEAKALLSATAGDNENLTGVQKSAQNFMIGFFDQSGVKPAALSDAVLDIIEGLNDVIAGSGVAVRDITTDNAEMRYAENGKQVYTLTGEGTRLRLSIEYGADKKTPVKFSITDISGGRVETADITITKDADGVAQLNIDRTQREYKNGYMIKLDDIEPLSMKLYGV